jgi:hypothetical protein
MSKLSFIDDCVWANVTLPGRSCVGPIDWLSFAAKLPLMSSENKESEKIRSNSLSGDAGGGSKKFYFLNTAAPSPASSKVRNQERNYQSIQNEEKLELGQSTRQGMNCWKKMFSSKFLGDNEWSWMNPFSWGQENNGYQKVKSPATREKPRKVPVKVEPKVFFANERTFLAWLHMAVTLASISMAIVA